MAPKTQTPTKEMTVQGVIVSVTQPYAEGHTITEAEAKALNQVRAENIGNNVRKAIKDLADSGTSGDDLTSAAQSLVSEKDAGYEFTMSSGVGRAKMDPLEKECQSIARAAITRKLKEMGVTQKAWVEANGQDAFNAKVAEVAENDSVVAAAKKALAERAKMAEATGDLKL